MVAARAVVLLSGGLDSATALAVARRDGFECHALSFRYGQRHVVELECSRMQAELQQAAQHITVDIDLRLFGGSALTADIEVPKQRAEADISTGIPVTYVPARNTIFLSYALAWAEVLGAEDIYIGVNVLDYSGYPDCRPEFIKSFEVMANLATRAGIEGSKPLCIRTPLIDLSKAEIIRLGTSMAIDYAHTSSCYDPDDTGRPCGGCDSCVLRAKGFAEVGLVDPLLQRFGMSDA